MSTRQFWTRFLTKKNQIVDCPNAEALAAFKHNIRDEWLALHLGQEKPKSMAALTTLMTAFVREKTAGWLATITCQRTMVLRIPRTAMAGHVATNISAALTVKIPRIQQSMPDSKALNPVSGKSHSNKALRAIQFGPYTRSLVSNTRHPRQASQPHQQGLLGVQAGRQVNC